MSARIRPAPPRARLLATAVDAAAALVVFAGFVAGTLAATKRFTRLLPDPAGWDMERVNRWIAPVARSATVLARNVRSPGQRVAGIRRVDARTGGPVTLRAALIRQLTDVAMKRVGQVLLGPAKRRWERKRSAYSAEIQPLVDATAVTSRS